MAVTRTWLGGGNNQASNPNDWGPTGAPQLGDTLLIRSSGPPVTTTFNVQGHALAGDTVRIGTSTGNGVNLTANLSHQADVAATMFNSTGTFNLSQGSSLNLEVWTGPTAGADRTTINMTGKNTLTLTDHTSPVTVNLKPGAEWDGHFNMGVFGGPIFFGSLAVNGGTFNNTGTSVVDNSEHAVINSAVIGTGSFNVTNTGPGALARMEFASSVGANQTIINTGLVVLDKPGQFSGHILMSSISAPGGSPLPGEIDLHGLANADSYSYRNDILSIYSHNTVIDRLNLVMQPGHGFSVEKVAGGVNVVTTIDQHLLVGGPILHG